MSGLFFFTGKQLFYRQIRHSIGYYHPVAFFAALSYEKFTMSAVFGISKGRDVEPEIELLNSARLHDAEG